MERYSTVPLDDFDEKQSEHIDTNIAMDELEADGLEDRVDPHVETESQCDRITSWCREVGQYAQARCTPDVWDRLGSVLLFMSLLMLVFSQNPTTVAIGLSLFVLFVMLWSARVCALYRQRQQQGLAFFPFRERDGDAQDNDDGLGILRMHPAFRHLSRTHLQLALQDRDFGPNDYDTLNRLDEEHRRNVLTGVPQSQIERLPDHVVVEQQSALNCSICIENVVPGDRIRTLPCLHQFHAACIDPWLRTKASCPICKFPVQLDY